MGIHCHFNNSVPLFILSVYLPSSNNNIDEYDEYLDYLWALCDSLSAKCIAVAIGDFNVDLVNSLGNRGTVNPNPRGVKLLDFANYFKLCPTNLLRICEGPLVTYFSHCERYKSTTDYICLPNCLYHSIVSCRTFDRDIENTSDHVLVKLQIEFSMDTHINMINDTNSYSGVNWSKFSQEETERTYPTAISADLENVTIVEHDNLTNSRENLTKIFVQHSHSLMKFICKTKNNKRVYFQLPDDVKVARSLVKAGFNVWKQRCFPLEGIAHDTYRVKQKEY